MTHDPGADSPAASRAVSPGTRDAHAPAGLSGTPETLHGTAVAQADGRAVLFLGPSGSGKSDLGFRMIRAGWHLVADDRVVVCAGGDGLVVAPPPRLAGLIELFGIGITRTAYRDTARLALVVQLVDRQAVVRMPDTAWWSCAGVDVPLLKLHAFDLSTPDKIAHSLTTAPGDRVETL